MRVLGILNNALFPSAQAKRVRPWFEINGDKTLRLNYPELDKSSTVFDVGGYEGQWASDIYAKYNCKIHIFEPHKEYADNIKKRFSKNENIKVHPFGLGKDFRHETFSILEDSSSVFKKSENTIKVEIQDIFQFIEENKIDVIDLIKINIEGGEFELLQRLIDSSCVKSIKNIQVQFHDFFPDAEKRMHDLQRALGETHFLTYQYDFVWENWKLKND